jgi:hypothetical protein
MAAKECGLHSRALLHLEFHIHSEQQLPNALYDAVAEHSANTLQGYLPRLYEVYRHLEDPDALEALKKQLADVETYDETMTAREIALQAPVECPEAMLKSGRYERALSDALSLRSDGTDNARYIVRAALRLCQWDELGNLAKYAGPSSFDFAIGRVIFALHANDGPRCDRELAEARESLVSTFKDASMVSYARVVPVLAHFRILEEVNDFWRTGRLNFGGWHADSALGLDDVEQIVAVRCALQTINKDPGVYEQWLQLARLCRKSELFFRAEMFCTRARKLAQSNAAAATLCTYETARLCMTRQKGNQALALLAQAEKTDGSELLRKLRFTRVKRTTGLVRLIKKRFRSSIAKLQRD